MSSQETDELNELSSQQSDNIIENNQEFEDELSEQIKTDPIINETHIEYYKMQLQILTLFRNLEAYVLLNQFNDNKLVK